MTEVRIASRTQDLGARDEPAAVVLLGDGAFGHWLPETRPARPGIELCLRAEEFLAAAHALVDADVLGVPVLPAKGALSAVLARHLVLLGCELALPVLITLYHLVHLKASSFPRRRDSHYASFTLKSHDYSAVFRDRNLAVILLLAFSSGLPLALTSGTLQAWMTVEGIDLSTIGFFTLVGLPYTWKFLWAPAMDRFVPPWLGRRRGWLIVTQVALAASIAAIATLSPRNDLALLAFLALFVAFASASQDIVFDAYRTDIATREQRGLAGALAVVGYRIAMLVSGALALVLVAGTGWIASLGWRNTYLVMAGLMAIGLIATLCGREPPIVGPAPRA